MQEKRKATPLEFFPPEENFEVDEKDKVNALLYAIQSKQLNEEESNRRLKAMALAEKTRKIELDSQACLSLFFFFWLHLPQSAQLFAFFFLSFFFSAQVDEFENELVNFVGHKKFKNKVGVSEIEKRRQEKDLILLRGGTVTETQ